MSDFFESGFVVGKQAWHGKANLLQRAPSNIKEAIREAELDWTVSLQPVFADYNRLELPCPKNKAVVRDSNLSVLAVVGQQYTPVQNSEAFEFFQPFLDSGLVELETAGAVHGGRKVWVLARVKDGVADVVKGDAVRAYFSLYNSHDGSTRLGVDFTDVRIVCDNTLRQAMAGFHGVWLRHTKGVHDALAAVQEAVDVRKQEFLTSVQTYRAMAAKPLTDSGFQAYIVDLFDTKEAVPRALPVLQELFEAGRGANPGTVWGGYNAITEWIDHRRGRDATRLEQAWWGSGRNLRVRAFDSAVALLG